MGQKLEKQSEKESLDNSDCSEQSGETRLLTAEENECKDNGSFVPTQSTSEIDASDLVTWQAREHAVTLAHTDPQIGQPIRHVGQKEHPLNTKGEWMGGDRESTSVTPTAGVSKTVRSSKEPRQILELLTNNKQRSNTKTVACSEATAMEEQGNGNKSQVGRNRSDPETGIQSPTASCNPANEEDFVVLERDETWMSSEDPQTSTTIDTGEDTWAPCDDDAPSQPSRNAGPERNNEKKRSGQAPADSVPTGAAQAFFKGGMDRYLAEAESNECWLQGCTQVGAAETGQVRSRMGPEDMSTQNSSELVKRTVKSTGDLERTAEEQGQLFLQEESRLEKGELNLSGSTNQGNPQKTPVDQFHQTKFAGVVSKRAKEVATGFGTTKEPGQIPCKAVDFKSPKAQARRSEAPQPHDKQSDMTQCVRLPAIEAIEACEEQFANLRKERNHVFFTAVITPPPATHLLPERDTPRATQHNTNVGSSQTQSMPREKPKVKGPPPPVPKKPKNPFIRLKTAQLMSTDVQRRGKDYLRSEERVRRRHTIDFNKNLPYGSATNQDMCLLWDERGSHTAPTNVRPLSADLSPWEHLALAHMDDRYGDMIDFDYCVRMAKLSPDEQPENLDMLQKRILLERRSRYKRSPPPVAKNPLNPFASSEMLYLAEGTSDDRIQRATTPSSNEEIKADFPPERVRSHRDAEDGNEVGSYKPVAELVKERNQLQRHQSLKRPEGAKVHVRVAEQNQSVKVSQMKNTFDVPKKSKERPQELQPSPKKGAFQWPVSARMYSMFPLQNCQSEKGGLSVQKKSHLII